MQIIGHRGARALAPENTLASLALAQSVRAQGWECDVRLTRDRVPVLLHDKGLERTSNWSLRVGQGSSLLSRHDYADLLDLDFGSWFVASDPFGTIASGLLDDSQLAGYAGQGLPRLDEALGLARGQDLSCHVEVKDQYGLFADQEVVRAVIQAAEGLPRRQLVFSSFRPAYLQLLERWAPDLPKALLTTRLTNDPLPLLRTLGASALHLPQKALTLNLLEHLHSAGVTVRVYTVNQVQQAIGLQKIGVEAIFTDFPGQMVAAL